ncbi:hypothetical protein [Gilliamella mensalis]|uniref:hypothetical protein n=1 Tax=Gilliamella mensalis TaxID=1908520 RepID=UPI001ABFBAB5|nr:hypothetical protein [Gilliamella mensalis]
MSKYSSPYNITPAIVNSISEISELLGHWSTTGKLASPQLRKENRIRTIQASLAIEHNSLSIEQVTAIMDGKHVLVPVAMFRKFVMQYLLMKDFYNGIVAI